MKFFFTSPRILLILLAVYLAAQVSLRANETWTGVFKLSRGDQKAEVILDFKNGDGMAQLPDLIPVPLKLSDVRQAKDSVFFTIGFRSGPAVCKAIVSGNEMTGVMYNTRAGDTPFILQRSENAPSIFGRPKPPKGAPVNIYTNSNSEAEIDVKRRLEGLLDQYDLEQYIYTKEIKIQSGTIPHSHPVLVLNTRLETDIYLLSTFLHEQMHWYTLSKEYDNESLANTIFKMYPKVPSKLPEGGGDERSTYLHILVCYLEYHTLSQVIGQEKAKAHMEFMTTQHYTWIYKTILNDYDSLKQVIGDLGLHFD